MAQQGPDAIAMAQQEMEYRVELFNRCDYRTACASRSPSLVNLSQPTALWNACRMVGSCYDKCMDKRYKDGDLSVGENTCLDRCASKYWATTSIVGQLLGASQGR